jgi:hypothetical protein
MECKTCFICLEDVSKKEIIFEWFGQWRYLQTCSCQFYAHNACFQKWYMCNGKCPYCKNEMYIRDLRYWQRYGKPICNRLFHFGMTLWAIYIIYKTVYDFDSYTLYGNAEWYHSII